MWYSDLFKELEKLENKEIASKMSAYMQNKFKFLGVQKPTLANFIKPYLKESKKYELDWKFIDLCFDKEYREAQYIAIEYLGLFEKKLVKDDFEKIKSLILKKSWWETVDSLDSLIGTLVFNNKELETTMEEWSKDENMWIRRVSIDYQQRYKENTNKELLMKIIINNLGSDEFFINKAIGWSLREYSKVNPVWVKEFIDKYSTQLNKLSIKEASKYLK